MEDIRDAQDSDTSSTSSWILLSNEEASDDSDENNRVLLKEALQTVSDTDSNKNSHSDLESDGISIISEGEFSQSYDDIIAYDSKNDDDTNDYTLKEQDLDVDTNEMEKTHFEQELQNDTEDVVIESETDIDCEKFDDIQPENIEEIMDRSPLEVVVAENVNSFVEQYDYRKMLTWPSIICTSVLIFAVIVFPYFSSKMDNTLDQSNMEAYDVYLMSEKEITDVDVGAYCRELQKRNDLYQDYDMKKCKKKLLKLIKKTKKNQISKEVKFLDKSMHYDIENQDNLKKKQNKKNKRDKYAKKIETNPLKLETFTNKNGELAFTNELHEEDPSDDNWTSSFKKKDSYKRKGAEKIIGYDDIMKKQTMLDKKEQHLLEKEKHLKEWESKLIEKEKKIVAKDHNIKNNFNDRFEKKKNLEKKKEYENGSKSDFRSKNESFLQNTPLKNNKKQNKKSFKQEYNMKKNNFPSYRVKKSNKKFEDDDESDYEGNSSQYFKVQNERENKTRVLEDDNVTMTGDWYINLVQARQDLRRKEEKALWWFDRVDYRKNKRNKAFWYFQYMFNRENLRYRPKHI